MSIGLIFWVIMLLIILGRLAVHFGDPAGPYGPFLTIANEWVLVILLFLLGWRVFGFIVQG